LELKEIIAERKNEACQMLIFENEELRKESGEDTLETEIDYFNYLRNSSSVCKIPVAGIFCDKMKERSYAIVIEQLNKMNLEA